MARLAWLVTRSMVPVGNLAPGCSLLLFAPLLSLLPLLCCSAGRVFLFLRRLWSLLHCVLLACRVVWLLSLVRSSFRSRALFSSTGFSTSRLLPPRLAGCFHCEFGSFLRNWRGRCDSGTRWTPVRLACGRLSTCLENSISLRRSGACRFPFCFFSSAGHAFSLIVLRMLRVSFLATA